jgi:hypothetical protein
LIVFFAGILWSCSDTDLAEQLWPESPEQTDQPADQQGDDSTAQDPDPGADTPDPDSGADEPPADTGSTDPGTCGPERYVFEEQGGVLRAEIEASSFSGDWALSASESNYSGDGYLVWTGQQSLSTPGNGLTRFSLKITTPGTYQFLWRSAVTIGSNGTEHNDSWLRFPDADDFFAQKDNSVVYPRGTGKTPNPAGASADGWFKIYRSGSDLSFKWQAWTNDHNGHAIFVTFSQAGTYTMEVSARSSGHAIDQFVLFQDPVSTAEATDPARMFSEISCGGE